MQLDQEGVVQLLHNSPFSHDGLDFSVVNKLIFFEYFDGVEPPCVDLPGEHDLAEAPSPDDSDLLEVVYGDFALLSGLYFHPRWPVQFYIQIDNISEYSKGKNGYTY